MTNVFTAALPFGAAIALGSLIGLERQWRQRTTGMRTHALVALGAASLAQLCPRPGGSQEGSADEARRSLGGGGPRCRRVVPSHSPSRARLSRPLVPPLSFHAHRVLKNAKYALDRNDEPFLRWSVNGTHAVQPPTRKCRVTN
ncbi:MgtC/SapB family protein [Citricoccus muralis]|uniref:MgtC/SapB family protein n=1 Tax=Citricoccus muralis TaxID=169134 RepID=UPI000E27577B|nr:MgtC/SapB family protein [Citricoccus muralis]